MAEYYVCHDNELYKKPWRRSPEVFHGDLLAPTKLTKLWQEFIMELNPKMSKKKFRDFLAWNKAFTNRTGFGMPIPRADFINGRNLNAKLPVWDKWRVCGGALLHGTLNGDLLTVETLNGSQEPPDVSWVLARPWLFFRCYSVIRDGSYIDFPHCGGDPVYAPNLATGTVTVRIGKFVNRKPYPFVRWYEN